MVSVNKSEEQRGCAWVIARTMVCMAELLEESKINNDPEARETIIHQVMAMSGCDKPTAIKYLIAAVVVKITKDHKKAE